MVAKAVVNFVLLSTLWYFLSIWGGFATILCTIRVSLRNYLWASIGLHSQARVRWNDCCASKKVGNLAIVDLEDALIALMGKRIIKYLNLDIFPLHTLLRHWFAGLWPPGSGLWPCSL